jgi:hypothetical protein
MALHKIVTVVLIVGFLVIAFLMGYRLWKQSPEASEATSPYIRSEKLAEELAQQLISDLMYAQEQKDAARIHQISQRLASLGEHAVPQLAATLRSAPSWNQKQALLSILSRIKTPETVKELQSYADQLREDQKGLKQEVQKAIAKIGIKNPTDSSRRTSQSLSLLSKIRNLDPEKDEDFQKLKETLEGKAPLSVKLAALARLTKSKQARAADLLLKYASQSSDPQLSSNALVSLIGMRSIESQKAVGRFFRQDMPEGKLARAVELLGAVGDKSHQVILEELNKRTDSDKLKDRIKKALTQIRLRNR